MKKIGLLYCGFCLISLFLAACAQDESNSKDTTPPGCITELTCVSEPGKILLTWKEPGDSDLYGAKIYTGIEENETVNFDKGIIVNKGIQTYEFSGLKDEGKYTFRISSVDIRFNESAYTTSKQVIFNEKFVRKVNNKFVCPVCNKEYDKDEAAAECHGSRLLYPVKISAGTYKINHLLQNLDLVNYHQEASEEKTLKDNSTIADVKKDFTGFEAKSITYNNSEVYVYYSRKQITYTFSSGSQGGFIDENTSGSLFGRFGTSNTRTLKGYYGAKIPGIEKPKADGYGFSKWDSAVPETFGSENHTFTAVWTSIEEAAGNSTSVYSSSEFSMLSGDSVTTSLGTAEINPFLMAKTEVTYAKWKKVIDWAESHGYTNTVSMDGAAGSYKKASIKYKDNYTSTTYDENFTEEKTYLDNYFSPDYDPSRGNGETTSRTVHLNLQTGKRYYEEDGKKYYFERGISWVVYNGNKVIEAEDPYNEINLNDTINFGDYVEIFCENTNQTYYINSRFINSDEETDLIKQMNSYSASDFELFETKSGYLLLIKRGIQYNPTYSGTDLLILDNDKKYVKIKDESETIYTYYVNHPGYILEKNNKKYVVTNTSEVKQVISPELVVYLEDSGSFYLIDKEDGNKKVSGNKVKDNIYSFNMKYDTVYFTPAKGIEKITEDLSKGFTNRDPETYKNDPVTRINWLMAAMWCNAASEYDGLSPVYYKPGTIIFVSGNVIRNSSFTENGSICTSDIANAVINPKADGYRLPTEAEWEYAARGGDQHAGFWNYAYSGSKNLSEVAWYYENSEGQTHEGGQKLPNSAGLYDMSGNVFEFYWSPVIKIDNYYYTYVRGGSWTDPESFNHVDSRNRHQATVIGSYSGGNNNTTYDYAQYNVGFRVVRSVIQ